LEILIKVPKVTAARSSLTNDKQTPQQAHTKSKQATCACFPSSCTSLKLEVVEGRVIDKSLFAVVQVVDLEPGIIRINGLAKFTLDHDTKTLRVQS
jgi:hypothetical protein